MFLPSVLSLGIMFNFRRCGVGLLLSISVLAHEARSGALETLASAAVAGGFGLRVTVGKTCLVNDLVVPTGTVSTAQLACNSVSAGNVEVVSPGATFTAGDVVSLQDGFSVATGVTFVADVDPFVNTPFAFVTDDSPASDAVYKAKFHLRLDGLALADGEETGHLIGYSAGESPQFRVAIRRSLSQNRLALFAWDDTAGDLIEHSVDFPLTAGFHSIELHWKAGAGDGELLVSIDEGAFDGLSGLDNSASRIDLVKWGAVDGTLSASSGYMDLDEFQSWRAP